MNYQALIYVTVGIVVLFLTLFMAQDDRTTVRYDCRISEISPDFPPEVREACRRLRAEKTK